MFLPLVSLLTSGPPPTRILFVGNSFTFVNDLPHQLINVATSLGQQVEVANSTIGGCTLFFQTPSSDARTAALLQEDWDFVVLQDYSALPTVQAARNEYLQPAVSEFAAQSRKAKIVMYMTWGYHDGNAEPCPSSDNTKCFPKGSLANLTQPPCATNGTYHSLVGSFECMGYSLARGYLSMLQPDGADLVAPCGLAWQVVRGSSEIPPDCAAGLDAQYDAPLGLALPFQVAAGQLPNLMLYRKYATKIDKHPNVAGQYLNALTFYSTLFGGSSPIGAAAPVYEPEYKQPEDKPLSAAQLAALQAAAGGAAKQCGQACGISPS